MTKPNDILQEFLTLAREHGVVAFVVSLIGPNGEGGYTIRSGAASRLSEDDEGTVKLHNAMVDGVQRAVAEILHDSVGVTKTYLN